MGDNSESLPQLSDERPLNLASYNEPSGPACAVTYDNDGWATFGVNDIAPPADWDNLLQDPQETASAPAAVDAPIPALPAEVRQFVPGDALVPIGIDCGYDLAPTVQPQLTMETMYAQQNAQLAQQWQQPQPAQDWQNQQAPLLPPQAQFEEQPAPAWNAATQDQVWNQPADATSVPATLAEAMEMDVEPVMFTDEDLAEMQKTLDSIMAEPATASSPGPSSPKKSKGKGKAKAKGKGKARARSPVAEKATPAPEPKKRAPRTRRAAAQKASAAIATAADVEMAEVDEAPVPSVAPAPAPAKEHVGCSCHCGAAAPEAGPSKKRAPPKKAAPKKTHQRARSSISLSDIKMPPAQTRRTSNANKTYYPRQKITHWRELRARRMAGALPSVVSGRREQLYTDDCRAPYGEDIGVRRICGECNKLLPDSKSQPKTKKEKSNERTHEKKILKETVRHGVMPGTTVLLHCNACGIYQRDKCVRRAEAMWGIIGPSYPDGDAEFPPIPTEEHRVIGAEKAERKRLTRKKKELTAKLEGKKPAPKKNSKKNNDIEAARRAISGEDVEGEDEEEIEEDEEDEECEEAEAEDEEEPEYDEEDIEVWSREG